MRAHLKLLALAIFLSSLGNNAALAQSTENKFNDLFVTSGYAAAFGAALGASALAFKTHPENHLRYISVGASLGFIGGTIVGSYIIFSPGLIASDQSAAEGVSLASNSRSGVLVQPIFSSKDMGLQGLATGFNLPL
ncbi:MAG: hypothetical protein AB7T49_14885 [Oligoflexales bacterium]